MVSFQMIFKLMLILTVVTTTTAYFGGIPASALKDKHKDCPEKYFWSFSRKHTIATAFIQTNYNDC